MGEPKGKKSQSDNEKNPSKNEMERNSQRKPIQEKKREHVSRGKNKLETQTDNSKSDKLDRKGRSVKEQNMTRDKSGVSKGKEQLTSDQNDAKFNADSSGIKAKSGNSAKTLSLEMVESGTDTSHINKPKGASRSSHSNKGSTNKDQNDAKFNADSCRIKAKRGNSAKTLALEMVESGTDTSHINKPKGASRSSHSDKGSTNKDQNDAKFNADPSGTKAKRRKSAKTLSTLEMVESGTDTSHINKPKRASRSSHSNRGSTNKDITDKDTDTEKCKATKRLQINDKSDRKTTDLSNLNNSCSSSTKTVSANNAKESTNQKGAEGLFSNSGDSESDDSDFEDVEDKPLVDDIDITKSGKRKSSSSEKEDIKNQPKKIKAESSTARVKCENIARKPRTIKSASKGLKDTKSSSTYSSRGTKTVPLSSRKRKKDSIETPIDCDDSSKTKVKKEPDTKPVKGKQIAKKDKKTPGQSLKVKKEESNEAMMAGIDENDVTSVLLRMEGQSHSATMVTGTDNSSQDSDSEEESDWEEVADYEMPVKSQIPGNPVEITLDLPGILKKRQKKKFDWKAWVRRKIRRFQKDVRINVHKVELLCLLSHGIQQNRVCNDQGLRGQAISLVPAGICRQNFQSLDVDGLKRLLGWFKRLMSCNSTNQDDKVGLVTNSTLEKVFQCQQTSTQKEMILVFVIIMRALGLDVKVVMSFQPLPIKETSSLKKNKPSPTRKKEISKTVPPQKNLKDKTKNVNLPEKLSKKSDSSNAKKNTKSSSGTKTKPANPKTKNVRKRKSASKVMNNKSDLNSDSGSGEFIPDSDNESSYSEENFKRKKGKQSGKRNANRKSSDSQTKMKDESSSDFEEENMEYRSPQIQRSKKALKKNYKILSSDSNDSTTDKGTDVWAEVYLPEDRKWICIDCIGEVINKPYLIESNATPPLHYCLAYSIDGSIKDVTARYASQWLSQTRKLRVDSDWWRETLDVYRSKEEHNEQDDENIKDQLVNRPLPTSISQFKSHPLYVLQRHLLKFEAIYPNSAVPVGFIRKEPVYARECVHVLHSRENWNKEGRAVMLEEDPYKMVKSRPKWKKPKEDPDKLDLQLFGEWQTDIFTPQPAVDGKIPRNEYGNVELFKPWMLPGGTVHLRVTALNRIAKKLGVDCVPAMVGWDYHGGFSHALLEGWVVCEEHSEALMAAWEEDQLIQQQKEIEKIEKRVLGNWKLLTRGLMIKEKLQKKFDLKPKDEIEHKKGKKKGSQSEEPATDAALSWPRRKMEPGDATTHFTTETM